MTRIVLVRHGHVEGIAPERFRGRRDVDLSALGIRQARATAQHIAQQWRPAALYSSPLRRCLQTAAGIDCAGLEELNAARMADVLRLICERHPQGTVVVVGHNACNRVLLLQALDRPLSAYWRVGQDPCAVSEIEISGTVITERRMNETHPTD